MHQYMSIRVYLESKKQDNKKENSKSFKIQKENSKMI